MSKTKAVILADGSQATSVTLEKMVNYIPVKDVDKPQASTCKECGWSGVQSDPTCPNCGYAGL